MSRTAQKTGKLGCGTDAQQGDLISLLTEIKGEGNTQTAR
jgi:hypothetical protein